MNWVSNNLDFRRLSFSIKLNQKCVPWEDKADISKETLEYSLTLLSIEGGKFILGLYHWILWN